MSKTETNNGRDSKSDYEDLFNELTAPEEGVGNPNATSSKSDNNQPFVNFHILPGNNTLLYKNKEEEALFRAVGKRNYESVINILKKGNINVNTGQIDIETGGYDGLTPVDVALNNNDFKMCKILIGYGADFKNLSNYAASMLNIALFGGNKEAIYSILDWYKYTEYHFSIVDGNIIGDNSGLPLEVEFS